MLRLWKADAVPADEDTCGTGWYGVTINGL